VSTTGAPYQPISGGASNQSLPPSPFAGLVSDASASPLGADSSGGGFGGIIRTIKRRQGIFLFSAALISGLMALNTLRERKFNPVFSGNFILQIESPLERNEISGEGKIAALATRQEIQNNIPALKAILRSPLVIAPVAERMGLEASQIIENLSIEQGDNTTAVMKVSLLWKNPEQGRLILEYLSKDFIRFSLLQRQASIDSGMKWLQAQAPSIIANVNKYEGKLKAFREQNLVIDPAVNATAIESQRTLLINQVGKLQLEQIQLQNLMKTVSSGKLTYTPSGAPAPIEQFGRQGVIVPSNADSAQTVLQQTIGTVNPTSELQNFELELAKARAIYKDDSPIVQSILAKRNSMAPVAKAQQLDALRAQLFQNAKQQDELNRQILLLNQNFKNSPDKIKEYGEISQKLETARSNYASYLSAIDNFNLEKARFVTPWQVISPPQFKTTPVSPDIRSDLLRALLFGLIGGVVASVLRERTDNVFHTPTEAEKELQLPVLGLVPYLPLEPGLNIAKSLSNMSASERFAIKESLRSLFTTFRLLRADRDIKLVAITSSTQGEGKSTAISIFASTLADLGLKVLVVDADMRLPTQAKYLGLPSGGDGFSSLLTDPNLELDSLLIRLQESFDFLPSGPKPPDPAKLLNSSRCQEVVQKIRSHTDYDIVLFDTPPCLMLADPILLGEKLDGILFLVGLGKVSRRLAPQAARRIKATGVDVLGIICNQVSFPTNLNDYGYEYGYYYHYGYSYADSYRRRAKDSYYSSKGLDSYFSQAKKSLFANNYVQQGVELANKDKAANAQKSVATTDDNDIVDKDPKNGDN